MSFRIAAKDQDDLTVLSALCQDAIVSRSDMTFLSDKRCFVMVLNRFRWEQAPDENHHKRLDVSDASYLDGESTVSADFTRVKSGLRREKVESVQSMNLDVSPGSMGLFNLLSITAEDNSLILTLSNQAAVRLNVKAMCCYLEDLSEAWPSLNKPNHDL